MKNKISIGLITATNEEYQSIYEILSNNVADSDDKTKIILSKKNKKDKNNKKKTAPFPYFIHTFDFNNDEKIYEVKLITIKSGYGKLNAVSASTFLLERYDINIIINFGACGSLSEREKDLMIGDFVLPSIIYESSYVAFKANSNLKDSNNFLKDSINSKEGKIFVGLNKTENLIHNQIIKKYDFIKDVRAFSSDMDIDSSEKKNFIKKFFNADICDWESFSIRKVAHLWKIPSIIFRVVSDFADESFLQDYNSNLKTILNKGAGFLLGEILPIACKIYISELNL